MRLRNVKGSRDKIAESEFVIIEPKNFKGIGKLYLSNPTPFS